MTKGTSIMPSLLMRPFQNATWFFWATCIVFGLTTKVIPLIASGDASLRQLALMMVAVCFFPTLMVLIGLIPIRRTMYYTTNKTYEKYIWGLLFYLQTSNFVGTISNIQGTLKGNVFRILFSYPSSVYFFSCLVFIILIMPCRFLYMKITKAQWSEKKSQSVNRVFMSILFAVAIVGLYETLHPGFVPDTHIVIKGNTKSKSFKKLDVIQLSDIHLGPMMSVDNLKFISSQVSKIYKPSTFLFMTGDFYTMESHHEKTALSKGLHPLPDVTNFGYACMGNHDHEVGIDRVKSELTKVKVDLLVEDVREVDVDGSTVQVIGMDYYFISSKSRVESFFSTNKERITRVKPLVRLVMLHNPSHFQYIPDLGDNVPMYVMSGHFHGGQFSFRDFIPSWYLSPISAVLRAPDFGHHCIDKNQAVHRIKDLNNISEECDTRALRLLYAHTGTGFYGVPIRLGTRNEQPSITTLTIHD
ncbi:ykoQ [Acrasis kona]|uniref:YkoQ n=1 Tax=Acrasis kona TaxID=1008807 RepID=A0AAW2ZD55_9EUKA